MKSEDLKVKSEKRAATSRRITGFGAISTLHYSFFTNHLIIANSIGFIGFVFLCNQISSIVQASG